MAEAAGRTQLERELAIELGVIGGVHDAHAAAPEAMKHEVAPDHRALSDRARLHRGFVERDIERGIVQARPPRTRA